MFLCTSVHLWPRKTKVKMLFWHFQSGKSEFLQYRIRGKLCSFKAFHQALWIRFVAPVFLLFTQVTLFQRIWLRHTCPQMIFQQIQLFLVWAAMLHFGCCTLLQSFRGTFFELVMVETPELPLLSTLFIILPDIIIIIIIIRFLSMFSSS